MAKSNKTVKKAPVRSRRTSVKKAERKPNWLVAILSGALALSLGVFTLFSETTSLMILSVIIGIGLLILGILELIGLLSSKRSAAEFAFSLMHSGPVVVIAILLLSNFSQGMAWPLILLAILSVGRGVVEILTAFATISDKTDRFIWLICGACGIILGIIVLNSGNFADSSAFFRFFSTYLMIYGVTTLTYSVHSRKSVL